MGVEVLYQVVEPEAFEVDARSISDAALTSIAVSLKRMADRAGAAASAERIKALEAALRSVVDDYDWVRDGPGDRDWNVLDNTIIRARALLKEPDQ